MRDSRMLPSIVTPSWAIRRSSSFSSGQVAHSSAGIVPGSLAAAAVSTLIVGPGSFQPHSLAVLNPPPACGMSRWFPQHGTARVGAVFSHCLLTTSHGPADILASMGSPCTESTFSSGPDRSRIQRRVYETGLSRRLHGGRRGRRRGAPAVGRTAGAAVQHAAADVAAARACDAAAHYTAADQPAGRTEVRRDC